MSFIILPGERKDDWAFENGKEVLCIPLNKKANGAVAIVDASDAAKVSGKIWTYNGRYVQTSIPTGTGYDPYKGLLLHRLIMDAPDGMHVDHIDHDTLNNCRSNLRLCTPGENRRNQKMRKDSQHRYKGVSFHSDKAFKKWQAKIRVDGVKISLKYHLTEEEAALAYNEAALKYHGEFALLNEVSDGSDNSARCA